MTDHLPIIDPDESGDVPRCRKECGSFRPGDKADRCAEGGGDTFTGTVCQPRLLRDPAIDLVTLHAHRLVSEWERADWRHRWVCWAGERLLKAVDMRRRVEVLAANHVELVDRLGLGMRA